MKHLLLLLVLSHAPMAHATTKYDIHFQQAAKVYLPGIDWRLLKAQAWQESRLDPNAVSPVGALGISQFMPDTWEQAVKEMGLGRATPRDARAAIFAQAWYMARLMRGWTAKRPPAEKWKLALASYNAGMGNILRAQKHRKRNGQRAHHWADISESLPVITGHHSRETIGYVQAIMTRYINQAAFSS